MNLRDALLSASAHGTDRLPPDADRRLRRRLGLESARGAVSARRLWLRPALAAITLAAIVAVVVVQARPAPDAVAGFVDTSTARWDGTVTGATLDVHAGSPASATVTWRDAAIVAAPGTQLAISPEGALVLAQGAIQIDRADVRPLVVVVPMGRVVIAAHRSSVRVDRQAVTILLDDGTGHFIDAAGQTHPLVAGAPLVSPPPPVPPSPGGTPARADSADAPVEVPSPRLPPHRGATLAPADAPADGPVEASGPPGTTPPSVPRRPDVPCTFKSDCEPGATCRKNESGDSVCMGHGVEGAACWFDSDCVSRSCTQRRCAHAP